MLTYEQALERVFRAAPSGRIRPLALSQAHGCVLAKSVLAPCESPRFDNSAVDGYAVSVDKGNAEFGVRDAGCLVGIPHSALRTPHVKGGFETGCMSRRMLKVIGCAQAGRPFRGVVRNRQAVRIFTGAPIPSGATAVIMQEDVTNERDARITVRRRPHAGGHVRRRGEDIRKGMEVLRAGRLLDARAVGLLAALGVKLVRVHEPPRVAILTTGDELRPAGARLAPGQIYESNGAMLNALVRESGARPWPLGTAADAVSSITSKIRRGLAADVLVIAGGVSVGEKDLCRAVLARCGVTTLLWRVSIKPGMPLFIGRRGRTLVFGLPGNPISVFVTFEEFVKPALMKLRGLPWRDGYHTPAVLSQELRLSTTRRTHFIRVACSPACAAPTARPTAGAAGPPASRCSARAGRGENGSTVGVVSKSPGVRNSECGVRSLPNAEWEVRGAEFKKYHSASRISNPTPERSRIPQLAFPEVLKRVVVCPVEGQGSHHLRSLVEADGWIRVVSDGAGYPAGSRVFLKRVAF